MDTVRYALLLTTFLVACDDPTPEAPECDAPAEGIWSTSGPGIGMPMETRLTFDPQTCAFTLTDWSMWHEGWTDGGTVRRDEVRLSGSDYWLSCVGALGDDGTRITGECADSNHPAGGGFELTWLEP